MNYRESVTNSGATFQVPENIVRIEIETSGVYGWQIRYGEPEVMILDKSASAIGAESALSEAVQELIKRIHSLDAPTGLRKTVSKNKTSDLPSGISGPVVCNRKGRKFSEYNFGISIPRFGDKPTTRNIYIGTENNMNEQRYDIALAKAIEVRNKAVAAFQEAKTNDRRAKAVLEVK